MEEINYCAEELVGEHTEDVRRLDKLLARVTSDIQFQNDVPQIKMLRDLVAKLCELATHEEVESSPYATTRQLVHNGLGFMQHYGKPLAPILAPALSPALTSLFPGKSGSSDSCEHSPFALKCTSTTKKGSSLKCMNRTGKLFYGVALLGHVISTGLNVKEAFDLSQKLKEIKKQPNDQRTKAVDGLAKKIIEAAEIIEETIQILFGTNFD